MKQYKNYKGLCDEEVFSSRDKNGKNEIEGKKKENLLQKIIHVFSEPMFLLLIVAASIYFFLGEFADGLLMLCFVLFVSGIEFVQEQKTDKALKELQQLSALNVKVIRNGEIQIIDSAEIVVDDIVLLEEGDRVPADGVVLECVGLGINESALTGESLIVYKGTKEDTLNHFKLNMCYSGCDVTNGSAVIRITAVGKNTEFGKIGSSLNTISKEKTPLEKQIKKLVVTCSMISLIFFIAVILLNFFNQSDLVLKERIIKSILSGITMAMATIPEEIPVVLTIFLAMGAWQLAKKNTLTRNMKAVETLGAVTVLCTDKTGTLTQNKMVVKETYKLEEDFSTISILACSKTAYDPTEIAIQNYAFQGDVTEDIYNRKLLREYVFNDEDKMMGQIWDLDGNSTLCVKGAYENVLPLCSISEKKEKQISAKIKEYALLGYRILAVAKQENLKRFPKTLKNSKLKFVGLLALEDPARDGVKDSILSCYNAGVRVIMITGDNGETAKGVAKEIGLQHNEEVITGLELETMSDEELKERVKTTNIFARVYPNHKMRIVKALQENNEIVAMTGDGVNDAPALKKAEIGIAMGKRGTNVAKEAADMILLDDNFNTIVDAIKRGRTIYDNIKKAIAYVLIIHVPIAFASLFVPLFNLPTLLLPVHIMLLELIIDPTSSILFQRMKPDQNIMMEKPRRIDETLIDKKTFLFCMLQGIVIFIAFLGSYAYFLHFGRTQEFAFTYAFSTLVLANVFVVPVLQSNHLAIENFVSNFKDRIITFIQVTIVVFLLLILYVPFLNSLIGTTSLKDFELLSVLALAILITWGFDFFKIFKK